MKFGPTFFIGGLVCVDFCNTFDHLSTPPKFDYFKDYTTILDWGKAAGILSTTSPSSPAYSRREMAKLVATRSLIFRLVWPFTHGEAPAEADLASFNTRFQKVSSRLRLVLTQGQYALVGAEDDPLERISSAAVRSTADLLVLENLDRIRQCGECGWLFYDTSRNHRRIWCSMKMCGNRAKARRHYERKRRKSSADGN